MTSIAARPRASLGWSTGVLRGMALLACPVLAGAAFVLLCLGIVTWLPALAALASALSSEPSLVRFG